MTCDMPCVSYMALYIVSMHIVNSNSRSSTGSNHWRLNQEEGKVVPADENDEKRTDDELMGILTLKVIEEDGEWKVENVKKKDEKQSVNGYIFYKDIGIF